MAHKRICIVSPVGGNGNYIALTLLNGITIPEFSYHEKGTHGDLKHLINHIHCWNDSHEKDIHLDDATCLQNVIGNKSEFVIINWWEKFYHNAVNDSDKKFGNDWLSWQKECWAEHDHPVVRAILDWYYAYKNFLRPELKRINKIENTFQFDALYTDYESTKKEFEKYHTEYTQEQYNVWCNSQKIVFNSYNEIRTKPINMLGKDYQKAIAIGMLGLENKLDIEQCWKKFKHKLD